MVSFQSSVDLSQDALMRSYAIWRAFAACVDNSAGPIGDAATLPAKRDKIEDALFFSFRGVGNAQQFSDLKRLIVQLGGYIELNDKDRQSIASLKIFKTSSLGADEKTKRALLQLLAEPMQHYHGVMSKCLKSTVEMAEKVESYAKEFSWGNKL